MYIFWVLFLFILSRVADFFIAYIAERNDSFDGIFPYRNELEVIHEPAFIKAFANFDGIHYLHIAQHGYFTFEQAYFPFYPLLIHFISPLFSHNYLWTGIILSHLFFLGGIIIFWHYLRLLLGKTNSILWTVLFFLCFPTSFFFGCVYPSGLFFFLIVMMLYLTIKKKYLIALIFSFLAALSKFIGTFLFIPLFFSVYATFPKIAQDSSIKVKLNHRIQFLLTRPILLLLFLSPIIGLFTYMAYLFQTTRNPLMFYTSQSVYGAHRATHLIFLPQVYFRYIMIFFTASHSFSYFIAALEFIMFNTVFLVLIYELYYLLSKKVILGELFYPRLGLNIFSLCNILLPTFTGTFSSIPRYSFFSLSFFIMIASIRQTIIKVLILCLFSLVHVLLFYYFIQGYFIS